jgi:hypothetical protein
LSRRVREGIHMKMNIACFLLSPRASSLVFLFFLLIL